MYSAEVVEHSRCTEHDIELYTLEVTLPRCLIPQLTRHRCFSFSIASSRAIPISEMIRSVEENPYIPEWHKNARGMQPGERITGDKASALDEIWLQAKAHACGTAYMLAGFGASKEDVNRLLEPFAWSTVLITGTDWENFFKLRLHKDTQCGLRKTAELMKRAMDGSSPRLLKPGQAHLPFVSSEERFELVYEAAKRLSVARCARVSYTKHRDEATYDKLLHLTKRLIKAGHWSPFEHVALATAFTRPCRNFRGWTQYRALVEPC